MTIIRRAFISLKEFPSKDNPSASGKKLSDKAEDGLVKARKTAIRFDCGAGWKTSVRLPGCVRKVLYQRPLSELGYREI